MSSIPPGIPRQPGAPRLPTPPPVKGRTVSAPKKFTADDYEYPSVVPIIIAILSLLAGLVAWLIRDESLVLAVIGYVSSPILVIVALGYDNYSQRVRSSKEPYFIARSSHGRILRFLAILAVLVSLPHVNALADAVSALIAERLGMG